MLLNRTPRALSLLAAWLAVTLLVSCRPASDDPASPHAEPPAHADGQTAVAPEVLRVVSEVEALDALRSTLASSISAQALPADDSTFARVCRPVGLQAKRLASEQGWLVRQVARRYRNPDHAPTAEEARLFDLFEADTTLTSLWQSVGGDRPGRRYARRITVERPCLACHGAKERRPDFVKEGYPDDGAFGFEEGDLRGLYVVFVPNGE